MAKRTRQDRQPGNNGFEPGQIEQLLQGIARGQVSVEDAMRSLRILPFEDLGFATLDHHRPMRKGFAEVISCAGKSPAQVAEIVKRLAARSPQVLGTRASKDHYRAAKRVCRDLSYDERARVLWLDRESHRPKADGVVLIAAGTSDLPVAEEAAITLEVMGHAPRRVYDVGVAGLHRLLHHLPVMREARVAVVVAGMEGTLPSVVSGLLAAPVIAVPTSVGYGASFGGLAALLGMLNSCAPGMAVVNIDNGFGAGYLAASINRACLGARSPRPLVGTHKKAVISDE